MPICLPLLVMTFVGTSCLQEGRRRLIQTAIKVIDVDVHLRASNAHVDEEFLSISMPDQLSKWTHIPFDDQKFIELCQEIGHSALRVTCNPLFVSRLCTYESQDCTGNTMSLRTWEMFYDFARNVGWDVSFGFTNLLRKANMDWYDADATSFLEYTSRNDIPIRDFYIGNEPNMYESLYGVTYQTPRMTVKDIQQFRRLLIRFPNYHQSTIVGPEITQPSSSYHYLKDFLKYGGCRVVDEISIHQYHSASPDFDPTHQDMLNTSIMSLLEAQFDFARKYMRMYNCHKPLRLTQASGISGGFGGFSDRFIAGFSWLDTLGVSARYQVTRVYRYNIWGRNVSLFNENFDPNPDYYLTVLFKRLVEGPVFNVTTSSPNIRAYANCVRPLLYPKGPIVIYLLNVRSDPVTLYLKQFQSFNVDTYFFTAGDTAGMLSRTVKVNDILMKYTLGGSLTFKPRPAQGSSIPMPANSYGFVVVPRFNLSICREMLPSELEPTGSSLHQLNKSGVSRYTSNTSPGRLGFEALALLATAILSLDILREAHRVTSVSVEHR